MDPGLCRAALLPPGCKLLFISQIRQNDPTRKDRHPAPKFSGTWESLPSTRSQDVGIPTLVMPSGIFSLLPAGFAQTTSGLWSALGDILQVLSPAPKLCSRSPQAPGAGEAMEGT